MDMRKREDSGSHQQFVQPHVLETPTDRPPAGNSPGPLRMQLVQALLQFKDQPNENQQFTNQAWTTGQRTTEQPKPGNSQQITQESNVLHKNISPGQQESVQPRKFNLPQFMQYLKGLPKDQQDRALQILSNARPQFTFQNKQIESNPQIKALNSELTGQNIGGEHSVAAISYFEPKLSDNKNIDTEFEKDNSKDSHAHRTGQGNEQWQQLMAETALAQRAKIPSVNASLSLPQNPSSISYNHPLPPELLEVIKNVTAESPIHQPTELIRSEGGINVQHFSNDHGHDATIEAVQTIEIATSSEMVTSDGQQKLLSQEHIQAGMQFPSPTQQNYSTDSRMVNSMEPPVSAQNIPSGHALLAHHNIRTAEHQGLHRTHLPSSHNLPVHPAHQQELNNHQMRYMSGHQLAQAVIQLPTSPSLNPLSQELQSQAVPGQSAGSLLDEMNGMHGLIGELHSQIKDLKYQLESKSQNDTVSKLTNKVEELRQENSFLKKQLRKLVMSPEKAANSVNLTTKAVESTQPEVLQQQSIDVIELKKCKQEEGGPTTSEICEMNSEQEDDPTDPDCAHIDNLHEKKQPNNVKPAGRESVDVIIKDEPIQVRKRMYPLRNKISEDQKTSEMEDIVNVINDTKLPKKIPKSGAEKKGKSTLKYDDSGKICCTFCDKTFVHSSSFYYHLKRHTGDRPYKCSFCTKTFYNSTQLKAHVRIHSGEKPFSCTICEKPFTEVSAMKKHLSTVHSDNKQHQCHLCDKAYKNARDLRNHVKKHEAPDGKPFICGNCNKRFVCERYAKICEKSHLNHRGFICVACGKDFKSAETLRMHEQIHQDKARHKCKHCGKVFRQQPSLYTHMKTHTRTNMLKCHLCGREFITKYRLKNHVMRHNGERPRKCKLCNKGFVEAHELARHMRVHNDITPYSCRYCPRTFKDNSNLKQHEKSHGLKKQSARNKMLKQEATAPFTPQTNDAVEYALQGQDEGQGQKLGQSEQPSQSQSYGEYTHGQVVTILQPLTSVEQQILDSGHAINVQVIPHPGSPSTSTQYTQSRGVMSLPSQPIHVAQNSTLEAQHGDSAGNLVIMDSDGTSILDMDSGIASATK